MKNNIKTSCIAKVISSLLISVLIILLCACSNNQKVAALNTEIAPILPVPLKTDEYALGNSMDNILNNGLVAQEGNWIYGPMPYYLHAVKSDGTGSRKICNDAVSFVSIKDKVIYYRNEADEFLYSINEDGSNRKKLNDEKTYYPLVVDDWIYYSTFSVHNNTVGFASYNSMLCKIKTDGTQRTILVERDTIANGLRYYYFYKGHVYFVDPVDSKIHSIDSNGDKEKVISDVVLENNGLSWGKLVSINDDWIYYLLTDSEAEKRLLYKMKIDGSSSYLVSSENTDCVNITGGWIYYTNGTSLNKMKTDGTGKQELFDKNVKGINVINNHVYCRSTDFVGYEIDVNVQKPAEEMKRYDVPVLPQQGKDINSFIPEQWKVLQAIEGDLNKDGLPDIAAVIEGKPIIYEKDAPRLLFIALRDADGVYSLSLQSDKAILRGDEGGVWGDPFYEGLSIDRGSLLIDFYGGSRYRWAYTYRFRYQDKGWYLIGATESSLDTGTGEGTINDYNLLTGDMITIDTYFDQHLNEKKTNHGIRKLVNLVDFDHRDLEY